MRCPTLNIFGTFFPSWLLCALIGVVAAVVVYLVLARTRLGAELRPALLAYPSVALNVMIIVWLTFYGH
ncbi:MAG TPA: YtcA family lipoprotein [Kofleriaceae bacterium]|nr:YtcA family lipoprotein [Kofleriaceae bacterium]